MLACVTEFHIATRELCGVEYHRKIRYNVEIERRCDRADGIWKNQTLAACLRKRLAFCWHLTVQYFWLCRLG